MSKRNTRDKLNNEVSAGSMADIAFLLLIFFLVTTTLDQDKGIMVKLPPYEENAEATPLPAHNVFKILVNEKNLILGRNSPITLDKIKSKIKTFVGNPMKDPSMSTSPHKAIVSLQTDRGTKYGTYISVYNELKSAYSELRDELSLRKYGKSFSLESLTALQYKGIQDDIPVILSEAEPFEFKD